MARESQRNQCCRYAMMMMINTEIWFAKVFIITIWIFNVLLQSIKKNRGPTTGYILMSFPGHARETWSSTHWIFLAFEFFSCSRSTSTSTCDQISADNDCRWDTTREQLVSFQGLWCKSDASRCELDSNSLINWFWRHVNSSSVTRCLEVRKTRWLYFGLAWLDFMAYKPF